ncbi:MAG: Restriction endonuclease [Parcubacteria group bacterium GW2011_GWA1_50_14]|uniref:Restriction endonuclease type IV Mrr domain-containing protein n=1 Tax=Candidatus Liptonbacteria bacterium GWB1_49_6 TaxID=1798644 RepID=A0A1G2C5E2_9BACT|nr:MAG: Restriction endonuclease [Parcubacteria group bacterium GW2011_GWA1_50_14]OGY96645.1 MAG: hypothetical protein A2122_00415 [Candidatus Liptonbacteria bacterium GWB1_49_6]
MDDQKWKKFERVVHEIQRELTPDANVELGEKIIGSTSKIPRQIDISIRRNVGQFNILIAIECKDLQAPVDVKDLDGFITVVKDIGAHKGAVVSSSGFTPGAIEQAKNHGIDTFRLIDTDSIDWKVYASIPTLLERNFLKGYSLRFEKFLSLPIAMISADLKTLNVFDTRQKFLGTVQDIIGEKWNKKEIEHMPGEQKILIGDVFIEFNDEKIQLSLTVNVIVAREYFLGDLPVSVRGLKNEQTGGLITKGFTTDYIKPFEIDQGTQKNWKKVDNPEGLSTKPVFRMAYSDVIPVDENYTN